jgi:uncharacterized protein with HEPN domain
VIRCLTVIGEAANRVSSETQTELPQISWGAAVGLRNVLVHDYHRIDLARVWTIVEDELPPLLQALNAHLGNID